MSVFVNNSDVLAIFIVDMLYYLFKAIGLCSFIEVKGRGVLIKIQEVAYVIKRFFPNRQKVALLTRSTGRINAALKQQEECMRLWPGMIITCSLCLEGGHWVASQVTIHSTPEGFDHECIAWLHHILELCYYFLPLESPCPDVFLFLKKCHRIILQSSLCRGNTKVVLKKMCSIKFLSLIGFYAQEEICGYLTLFQELSEPFVDFTSQQKVEFLEHKLHVLKVEVMDEWIVGCLKSHPMFKTFKTITSNYL